MKLQIGIDGKQYEVDVEILEDDAAQPHYIPAHPPTQTTVTLPASGAPPASSQKPPANEGPVNEAKVCRSPIAGMVTKVNVQPGQQIKANDNLLVLEAMKMETNVTSPADGKVKSVRVAQGDGVQLNQILVEFE